jgi:hypothetical protein
MRVLFIGREGPRTRRPFGRSSNTHLGEDRETTRLLGALNAEIILLREENARLKAAAHEGPGLGKLLEHARDLPATLEGRENMGDEAAEMLVEGLVIRAALFEVCDEIQASMAEVKARLTPLGTPLDAQAPPAPDGEASAMRLVPPAAAEEADRRAS